MIGRNECQFSWGFDISNIGTKVSYDHGASNAFLPTNLRLGANFMFPASLITTPLAFGLDLNKLLVPTKPRQKDFLTHPLPKDSRNMKTRARQMGKHVTHNRHIQEFPTDAPQGGMKEELQEIGVSFGAEYAYNQQFFVRAGYNYEHANKGGRSYFAFGAGFSLNVVQLDASYMLATAQSSPLDQTLRFTLTFDMDGLRDLLGKRRR